MTIKEVTPEDSSCPVFLDPIDADQLAVDETERAQLEEAKAARAAAKLALLERLGITEDEAKLLLG